MNVGNVLWAGIWLCFTLTVCLGNELSNSLESEHDDSTLMFESSAQHITVLATSSHSTSSDAHTSRTIQTPPTNDTSMSHIPKFTKSSDPMPAETLSASHEPTEPIESPTTRSTRDHRASKSSTDQETGPTTSPRIDTPHKTEHSALNTSVDNRNLETTQTAVLRSKPGILHAPQPYIPLSRSSHAKTSYASWCTVLLLICHCLGIVCLM
ncbi:hypothetical protein GGH14_003589 [Coemansia sp. RSA 370]|nr:hypothetical protein GGH14_003589 [Coemansia sp. RSA 370]